MPRAQASRQPYVGLAPSPAALLTALGAAFYLAACSLAASGLRSLPEPPVHPRFSPAELAAGLDERQRTLDSLETGALMEYTSDGKTIKAREQIVVRRPASLRVEAMSPFGVAMVVVSDGARLSIFDPAHKRLIRAPATAEALDRFVHIPMAPADAVALLMGLPPGSARPDGALSTSVSTRGGMTILAYPGPGAASLALGFERGRLALVQERPRRGGAGYEVRYSDYRDIGGVMFPYRLEADFPAEGSHLTLSYRRPIINGRLPASTFLLSPAGAFEEVGLDGSPVAVQALRNSPAK